MFGLFSLLTRNSLSIQDEHSNQYSDGFKTLISVYPGQKTLSIRQEVTNIYGKDASHNAFSGCKDIESVTFDTGSQLEEIGSHGFYSCQLLTEIDLTPCTKLHTICDHCFKWCYKLANIYFPDSLTKIENYGFERTGIVDIVIPSNILTIEEGTFLYCTSLNEVTFSKDSKITELSERLFESSGLKKLNLPGSLTSINGGAFNNVKNLKEITISDGSVYLINEKMLCTKNLTDLVLCPAALTVGTINVPSTIKTIKEYAFFASCASEVIIGENVNVIEPYAFQSSAIKRVTLKDTITSIGMYAFSSCPNLKEIHLPSGIKVLERNLFSNNNFESFTVPNLVTNISEECFSTCQKMRTITLPPNLQEIGKFCFLKCTSLGEVILPKDLEVFGGGAFSGCTSIHLSFAPGSKFEIDDQFLITSDSVTIVRQYIGSEENATVNIPDSVTLIDSGAFTYNNYIRSVKFGAKSQLTKINEKAFANCGNLNIINFPENLFSIEKEAFLSSSIKEVTFGEKIRSIAYRAFVGSSIKRVTFATNSDNLHIGREAFYNCYDLETITLPENINYIGSYCFSKTFGLKSVIIPGTTKTVAENFFQNSGLTRVTFSSTPVLLKEISPYAFNQNKDLTEFQFAEGITTIKEFAFSETGLTKVVLPSTIVTLEKNCFSNCVNLTEINLGDSSSKLQTIQGGILEGCLKLETIECKSPNFTVKQGALYNKDKTKIYAFPAASKIHIVQLPSEVLEILPGTFYSCTSIYSITIPDDSNLTSIGVKAFANCINMRTINIPISTTIVGTDAFKGCDYMSCGIIISNNTKEFRDLLINKAKIPRRCFDSCIVVRSHASCNKYSMTRMLFIGFSILLQ